MAGSVTDKLADLIATLHHRSPHVEVLIAAASALALEIDMALQADENGKTKSAASAVREFRAVVDELMLKGRADGDEEVDDWTNPAGVGATTVRHLTQPKQGNVRARGGGGRKAAG